MSLGSQIHVSEEWERNEHNRLALLRKIGKASQYLALLGLGVAFMIALVGWSMNGTFDGKSFACIYGLFFILEVINSFNMWPKVEMEFETSEPLANQLMQSIAVRAIRTALLPLAAIFSGFANKVMQPERGPRLPILLGVAVGVSFPYRLPLLLTHPVSSSSPLLTSSATT